MKLPEHLGGHGGITHIDIGILKFFKTLGYSSFLDIGCGPGGMIESALSMGYEVKGIDGDFEIQRNLPKKVIIHDYTKRPLILSETYDLVWSCEFVEHVEEQYIPNFMTTFKKGKTVCMTFAPPGTPGYHHVNLKNENYWKNTFADYGFSFNKLLTERTRKESSMKRNFFRDNGLVFDNVEE